MRASHSLNLCYCVLHSTANSRLNNSATYTVCLPASCAERLHVEFAKHSWQEAVDTPKLSFCQKARRDRMFFGIYLENKIDVLAYIIAQLIILLPMLAYFYLRFTLVSLIMNILQHFPNCFRTARNPRYGSLWKQYPCATRGVD